MIIATLAALLLANTPEMRPRAGDWDQDSARWFVSGRFDAGLILKAAGHVGYGQPFWLWAGLQASTTASLDFFAASTGIRLALPIVEFSAEYRRTEPFRRGRLPEQASYDTPTLRSSPREGYDALDLDLWAVAPFPGGYVFAEGLATWLPDDAVRYEEMIRAVARGWCGAVRGALGARLGEAGWMRVGAITEAEWSERNTDPTIRVGPSIQLVFGRHADLVAAALWQVAGIDNLSFRDGMTGALALRWRVTTGEEAPVAFP